MSTDILPADEVTVGQEGSVYPDSHNTTPEQRLAELAYQRDGLLRAAADNRNEAMTRQHQLQSLIADGQLDPDYDVEGDHRYVSLLEGAQHWERQAQAVDERIEQAREAWGRLAEPIQGPVKARVRRRQTS